MSSVNDRERSGSMADGNITAILKTHTAEWMAVPGVVAVGEGEFEGQPCVRVYVIEKTEEIAKSIPSAVKGFRVVVETSGEIRARQAGGDTLQ